MVGLLDVANIEVEGGAVSLMNASGFVKNAIHPFPSQSHCGALQ